MRKRLYKQLDRLARDDQRRHYVIGALMGWIERSKDKTYFRGTHTRDRRLRPCAPDHFIIRNIAKSRRVAINAFNGHRSLGADFIVAVPHSKLLETQIRHQSNYPAEFYIGGMKWDWIELKQSTPRSWNVRIYISPAYWRGVEEVGVQYHDGKLVQSVTNRRSHGDYTAWDVNYFDIRDKKNPKYIHGCLVRRDDIWSLSENFSAAYAECKNRYALAAVKALKDTLKDEQ